SRSTDRCGEHPRHRTGRDEHRPLPHTAVVRTAIRGLQHMRTVPPPGILPLRQRTGTARRRKEATMGGRRPRGPGIARLSALCAVLFGLFLMHGAPTTAADGCHGQMHATLPMYDAHASSMASAHAMPAEPDDAQADPADDMRTHGDLCVAVPAQ